MQFKNDNFYSYFLRQITPPLVWRASANIKRLFRSISRKAQGLERELLFDGDSEMFIEALSKASVYGEYGVGQSTVFVANNYQCEIRAVDTSPEWCKKISQQIGNIPNINIKHVFLGEVGDWGRPKSYKYRNNLDEYFDAPWDTLIKPDVVLIDGRFRVACFAYSLGKAEPGTLLIFDDYNNRPHYQIVEQILSPIHHCGRQALFVVPEKLNREMVDQLFQEFRHVMD